MRFRFKIIHFMVVTAVLAFAFAAIRPRGVSIYGLALLLIAAYALSLFLLIVRPSPLRAVLESPPEDPEQLITALERGLTSIFAGDPEPIILARFTLMQLYKERQRYEQAIAHGRRLLGHGLSESFECRVRLELAICLDFLGREEEAERELWAAEEMLDNPPDDARGLIVRGRLLERRMRFVEAAESFERALERTPVGNADARAELLICLCLACLQGGRCAQALTWSERALAEEISDGRRLMAHQLAGVAAAHLGRLDEAERHRRRAYDLAVESGDPKAISDGLAALAGLERLRGNLDEAERICLDAEALCPDRARDAVLTHAILLRDRGQYGRALEQFMQAGRVGVLSSVSHERRVQGYLNICLARARADVGRLDEAWVDLQHALAELGRDPRSSLFCQACWVRLLALQGTAVEALRRSESLISRLEQVDEDPSVRRDSLEQLGLAFIKLGEYERALRCWERFLAIAGAPISKPLGLYHLGECRRHLGDPAGALDAFQSAVATGIDCHHARLAQQAIAELARAEDGRA